MPLWGLLRRLAAGAGLLANGVLLHACIHTTYTDIYICRETGRKSDSDIDIDINKHMNISLEIDIHIRYRFRYKLRYRD